MKILLKRAGIVVAAATAGLLSLAPLAMASGDDHCVKIEDSQVNECTATQTNGLVSILDLNGTLQCVNVQVSVGGNNTAD